MIPDIRMSTWSPDGIRRALKEGEEGIDPHRWGAGLVFRVQAIQCAVCLYDAVYEHPEGSEEEQIEFALVDYAERSATTGVNMSRLLTVQLMHDMHEAMTEVVREDLGVAA